MNESSSAIANLSLFNRFSFISISSVIADSLGIKFSKSYAISPAFRSLDDLLFLYLLININRFAIFLFSTAWFSKIFCIYLSSFFKAPDWRSWLVKLPIPPPPSLKFTINSPLGISWYWEWTGISSRIMRISKRWAFSPFPSTIVMLRWYCPG